MPGPGVIVRVVDRSTYLMPDAGTYAFAPFVATWGPYGYKVSGKIYTPIIRLVRGEEEFLKYYGEQPSSDVHISYFCAYRYSWNFPLWCARVIDPNNPPNFAGIFLKWDGSNVVTQAYGAIQGLGDASDDTTGTVYNTLKNNTELLFGISAKWGGSFGNNIYVDITLDLTAKKIEKLVVQKGAETVETYEDIPLSTTATTPVEVPEVNEASSYLHIYYVPSRIASITGTFHVGNQLSGGSDGNTVSISSSVVNEAYNTIVEHKELYDVDLIFTSGFTDTAVSAQALNVAQQRGDCFAVIDPPDMLNVPSAVGWVTGGGIPRTHFGATYFPWLITTDPFSGKEIPCPPSVFVSDVYGMIDANYAPWGVPAGYSRGYITAGDVRVFLEEPDRDTLYSNSINPIRKIPNEGIYIWGNKTLQDHPSALDRVHASRGIIYIEKQIARRLKMFVFEVISPTLLASINSSVTAILADAQARNGLYDYNVEVVATPELINQNTVLVRVTMQPTKVAEYIIVEFTVKGFEGA